jgi:hypothetical protein
VGETLGWWTTEGDVIVVDLRRVEGSRVEVRGVDYVFEGYVGGDLRKA